MKKVYISPIAKTLQLKTKNSLLIVSGQGTTSVTNTPYDSSKGSVFGREGYFDEDEE